MPTGTDIAADLGARIAQVQSIMRAAGVDALLVHGAGSPDGLGLVRYVAGARAWAGPIYVVLRRDDPQPWILSHSSYQAAWTRSGGAGPRSCRRWSGEPRSHRAFCGRPE